VNDTLRGLRGLGYSDLQSHSLGGGLESRHIR
jgi:hypothetical protein